MAPEELIVQPWEDLLEDEKAHWRDEMARLNLPPLSHSAMGIDEASDDPVRITNRLSGDPLLASKVLAVANSAAMGRTREVQSLEQAVVYLGTNLIKSIVAAYQMEEILLTQHETPRAFLMYIRDWAAASSTLAYNIAFNVRRPLASQIGTVALLARIGALLFAGATPPPDQRYLEMANDAGRLKFETTTWGMNSPVLSGQLARRWGMPDSMCVMLERSWEPLFLEMPRSETNEQLTLVATAVSLAVAVVGNQNFDARVVLDRANSAVLKANLQLFGLLDRVLSACVESRMRRELTALLQK